MVNHIQTFSIYYSELKYDLQVVRNLFSPVHLVLDLESLHLILSVYFFKNAEKITSGDLILYLEKIILYFNKKYLCSKKLKHRIKLILNLCFLLHNYFL